MTGFTIRPLTPNDREQALRKVIESWGGESVIVHGQAFYPAELPGFVACAGDEWVGLLTYRVDGDACEVVTLNSWRERIGVGSALLETTKQAAAQAGCRRVFLVTTNDDTHALRFYQKRGFNFCAVRLNVMQQARRLKPGIPHLGADHIPIRDEMELEFEL
ncbi:MAG: GNAT family N-acetyltransferase [Chloroflexi bacterium]|nr:GNAT family N-acetyltransferase [Chloroflexota bacterium]